MGIKFNFNPSAFRKKVDEVINSYRDTVLKNLIHMGGECVAHARSNAGYTDRTGNLKNSIGYVIFENGEIIHEEFKKTSTGDGSSENPYTTTGEIFNKSREVAKAAAGNRRGFVLVIVAGMEYAMYVESKSKNVLASTELYVLKELPKLIADISKLK